MRIAFLSYQWPGLRMGGIGSYVRQSAAALALAGHEPHIFTLGDDNHRPDNIPPGVVLHQTPDLAARVLEGTLPAELTAVIGAGGEAVYRLAIAWLLTASFGKQHLRQPFDIVEAADVDASGLPLLLDGGRPVPVVVHLHTCTAIADRINHVVPGPRERLIEAMEAAQIHLADALCAPTRAVVRETEAHVALSCQPTTIAHPFVCAATAFVPPPLDGPVLFVGRLEWRKGCGVIALALSEFLSRHPKSHFRFIGPDTSTAPGGNSVRLHILAALPEAVRDRVEFTGELPPSQVDAALRGCSFCVLPSVSENFSLAVCEAMAAGRTTIIAAGTGSVELAGDAALAVEPGSASSLLAAMELLYRDRRRLNDLSQLAFERVRSRCDPLSVSRQRAEFYRGVIDSFSRQIPNHNLERLGTLPATVAAAVLPCIAQMTAALLRVDAAVDSPGQRLDDLCQTLTVGEAASAQVLLYGAGKYTARLLSERHRWERHGHRVVGLIDDHPRFGDMPRYLGLPVRSLAAVQADAAAGNRLPAVVLSTDTYEQQFWEQTAPLRKHGVRVLRLSGD